jgi:hypothetical protein
MAAVLGGPTGRGLRRTAEPSSLAAIPQLSHPLRRLRDQLERRSDLPLHTLQRGEPAPG